MTHNPAEKTCNCGAGNQAAHHTYWCALVNDSAPSGEYRRPLTEEQKSRVFRYDVEVQHARP